MEHFFYELNKVNHIICNNVMYIESRLQCTMQRVKGN